MTTTYKDKSLRLLEISNAIQRRFILSSQPDHILFKDLLEHLLKLTESEFGFIGQVFNSGDKSYLKILAATEVHEARNGIVYEKENQELGFLNPQKLLDLVLKQKEKIIFNDPASSTALSHLQDDHDALYNLMCLPLIHDHHVTGVIGLANRIDGYDQEVLDFIKPLSDSCSVIIEGSKARQPEKKAFQEQPPGVPANPHRPVSMWEWDLETKQFIIPENISKAQAWQSRDLPNSLRQFFTSYVHPEDQPNILAHYLKYRYSTRSFVVKCRLLTAEGLYRWYKIGIQQVMDQAGKLKKLRGMIKDIHRIMSSSEENQRLQIQTLNLQDKLSSNRMALRQNLQESREIRKQLRENEEQFATAFKNYNLSLRHPHHEIKENVEKIRDAHLIEERQQLTEKLTVLYEELEKNLQETEDLKKKLEAGEQLLKNAINTYGDVFIIFDADRRIKFINQQGLKFLGMKEDEVIGKRDEEFLPDEVTRTYLPTLKKAYQLKKEQSLESSFPTSEGVKEVSIRYIPQLDENGDVYELLAITFDITEQKQVQRETLKAKEQYQYLFHHSPLPMWIYDLQTLRFMDVNEAATINYGWTKDEFLNMSILDIRAVDEKERLSNFQKQKISSYSNSGIWKHLRKDGSTVDVEITSHEFVFNSRKARIVLANDVTERLEAEKLQQQSEANLKATLDNGILSFVLLDREGKVVLTDKKTKQLAHKVFGQEMEPGSNYVDFLPEKQISGFHHNFTKALHGESTRFENVVDHGSKGIFALDVSYSPVTDSDNKVSGVVVSFLDIADRKQAENKLAESEANLKAIFDATSHSYFLVDKDYQILTFNKQAATSVWMTHGKELKEGDNMLAYSDPELIDNFKMSVQRALHGVKVYTERRVAHPLEEKWYNVQYLPVANEVGKIYGVAFVAEDITQSKRTELALKKSYRDVQKFKSALYNSALISVTDLKGNIIEVNDKFCKVSKYERKELLGKPHKIVNSGYHPPSFFKEMWETIERGEIWRGDVKNKAKDGSYYWVDTYIHPIWNEQGEPDHYLSVRYLITDRKEAEQETQQYARRLDDILENITDGFFTVDREWRFTRVNNVLEKSLGRRREELIGMNVWNTFPEAVQLKFYTEYSKTMHEGKDVHFEEYFAPLDTWFEAHAYPAEDGISVYFRDITERKKSEEEIRKLSLVASKTDNTVIITNERREIEWVNEGFSKLTGYRFDEVIGRNPGHFLQGPETDKRTVKRIGQKLQKQESLTEELINYNKKGEKYWIKMDINPIFDQEGRLEKFIAIQSNITERKQAELEKAHLVEELIQKNKSLEEYAFITSHNLRAPIAHILGLTYLFNEEEIDDPFNVTLIKQLGKASENLDSIIKDITELLAIRQDIVRIKENVNIKEVAEKVIENLQNQINATGATIKLEIGTAADIYTVKDFMYSMLLNLMSNALKYRHPERQPKIEVIASIQQDQKRIEVRDNGLGIDLHKYGKKIFSLYSRFHSHVEGKGVGLHLVKTLAEAAGGSVRVESKLGKGSSFLILFPNEGRNINP